MPHGFTQIAWASSKETARNALSQRAVLSNPFISYGELVAIISAIQISPEDPRLGKLLDEISVEENEAGRGMLSVIVVHQTGDKQPGAGFFKLAKRLGRLASDQERLWVDELANVKSAWTSGGAIKYPKSGQTLRNIGGRPIETLPFRIPEYPHPSHPISRGAPKFHKLEALSDWGEGKTPRTEFFERILVGMFLRLGRAVPYAFDTIDGEIRSLDAGCIKFLLNRRVPEIAVSCNSAGEVASVTPLTILINRYLSDDQSFRQFASNEIESNLPFDIDAEIDERRRIESESVRREGVAAFRSSVLWAWDGCCAVTGTVVRCTLEAAHIYPYNGIKTNDPSNGIALRSDMHALFDSHLFSLRYVHDRLLLDMSKELRGTEYERYAGTSLKLPEAQSHRPHSRLVEHHRRKFEDAEARRP